MISSPRRRRFKGPHGVERRGPGFYVDRGSGQKILRVEAPGRSASWAIANAAGEIMDDVPAFKTLREAAAHLHAQTPEET